MLGGVMQRMCGCCAGGVSGLCSLCYFHIEYTRVLYGAHSWMKESVQLFSVRYSFGCCPWRLTSAGTWQGWILQGIFQIIPCRFLSIPFLMFEYFEIKSGLGAVSGIYSLQKLYVRWKTKSQITGPKFYFGKPRLCLKWLYSSQVIIFFTQWFCLFSCAKSAFISNFALNQFPRYLMSSYDSTGFRIFRIMSAACSCWSWWGIWWV